MEYAQALKTSLLILLLITLAEQVDADSPAVVGVIPSEVIVQNVGEVFSVNITITNVDNLFGYEVKIFYNSTQLNALWVSLPSNHFLRPSKDDMLYVIKNTTHNAYNATHKFIWFACTLLSPETERSGSGVLLTIYFNATANGGPYPLTPAYPGYTYPAKLSNPEASQIPCTSTPSQITVVPEFPPVDTTPPTISILSPENKTYLVSDVSLTFTVNESTSWIGYSLDNQNNITISGNTTLVNLSDEKYTIKVYANDTAGNMGASEMVYFRIETPAPFPTWIVAAIVTMIAGVGVAILIYFAKVKKQLRNSNNNPRVSIIAYSTTIHDNNTISSHRLQKNDGRKQTFKV